VSAADSLTAKVSYGGEILLDTGGAITDPDITAQAMIAGRPCIVDSPETII